MTFIFSSIVTCLLPLYTFIRSNITGNFLTKLISYRVIPAFIADSAGHVTYMSQQPRHLLTFLSPKLSKQPSVTSTNRSRLYPCQYLSNNFHQICITLFFISHGHKDVAKHYEIVHENAILVTCHTRDAHALFTRNCGKKHWTTHQQETHRGKNGLMQRVIEEKMNESLD